MLTRITAALRPPSIDLIKLNKQWNHIARTYYHILTWSQFARDTFQVAHRILWWSCNIIFYIVSHLFGASTGKSMRIARWRPRKIMYFIEFTICICMRSYNKGKKVYVFNYVKHMWRPSIWSSYIQVSPVVPCEQSIIKCSAQASNCLFNISRIRIEWEICAVFGGATTNWTKSVRAIICVYGWLFNYMSKHNDDNIYNQQCGYILDDSIYECIQITYKHNWII